MSQDLLCFSTAGNVDDGKSTLIGRLLFDTGNILEDQYQALAEASERRGKTEVDLALLTDGLLAEREQGITIDVAYRYFLTETRKFIIVDSPGHEQYTRNMVTGASHAHAAVILVDARQGIQSQTRRHSYIARLLGIPSLIFAINKMDLIHYDAQVFDAIKTELTEWLNQKDDHFSEAEISFIPMSALKGDMIVHRGTAMPWYTGQTLLEALEQCPIEQKLQHFDARFPIQGVSRPSGTEQEELHDFRGYTGLLESGSLKPGDAIRILPAGHVSTIDRLYTLDGWLDEAHAGQSITVLLKEDIDISRGDMIVAEPAVISPKVTKEITADICWLSDTPMDKRRKYLLKHTTRKTKAIIESCLHTINIRSLEPEPASLETTLTSNEIGRIRLKLQQPIVADLYAHSRPTGSFILIDEATLNTVAAGLIRSVSAES